MNRKIEQAVHVALLTVLALLIQTGEAAESGSANQPPPLEYGSWSLPKTLVTKADPTSTDGTRLPMPGFQKRERNYDAKEFLTAIGISFPNGAEAFCSPESGRLFVRNTRQNLDRISRIFTVCNVFNTGSNISIEFSLYECALPVSKDRLEPIWPTYSELIQLDLVLRGRAAGATKNGHRSEIRSVTMQKDPVRDGPKRPTASADGQGFRSSESGMIIKWESTTNPAETIVESLAALRWRGESSDGTTPSLNFVTSFVCWDGQPLVLNVAPSVGSPGKYLVTTCTARITPPQDWTLEKLKTAAATISGD